MSAIFESVGAFMGIGAESVSFIAIVGAFFLMTMVMSGNTTQQTPQEFPVTEDLNVGDTASVDTVTFGAPDEQPETGETLGNDYTVYSILSDGDDPIEYTVPSDPPEGMMLMVSVTGASTNTVELSGSNLNVGGLTTVQLSAGNSIILLFNGTSWVPMGAGYN